MTAPSTLSIPADDSWEYRLVAEPQLSRWSGRRGDWMLIHDAGDLANWTVVAADREGLRRAREIVVAFIGPAVGELGTATSERLLRVASGDQRPVLCTAVRMKNPTQFREATQRMVLVRASMPADTARIVAGIAQLLRDFRLALYSQDFVGAEQLLARIQRDGRLSGENLRFLQIEFYGRAGRWIELRNLEWFLQLARSSRPRVITELMTEALWRVEFVDAGLYDPPSARARYSQLPPDFLRLFDAVDIPSRGGARRLVALRALDQGSAERLVRIREQATDDEGTWIDALQAVTDPTEKLSAGDKARRMLDDGRYGDVVALAVEMPEEIVVVQAAVRAVFEAQDSDLATKVMPLLTIATRNALPATPGFVTYLGGVEALAGDGCDSWTQWMDRVASAELWPDALGVVTEGAPTWPIDELCKRAVADAFANQLMTATSGVNDESVEASMYLLCCLAAELTTAPGAAEIVDTVLSALMQYEPTKPIGEAFLGLVQSVLRAGPTTKRYRDLLDVCLEADQLFSTAALLPVALDLLDEIAMHPCPDSAKRMQLAVVAYNGLKSLAHAGHLDFDDARLAQLLLAQLGLQDVALWSRDQGVSDTDQSEADPWEALAGRKVMLYTLLDGLGARFTQQLQRLCPSVTVSVREDHDGSKPLREAAVGADYVIVDTRHAKHAATRAIDDVYPKSRQILPDGKGVSSFIRSLREVLRVAVAI